MNARALLVFGLLFVARSSALAVGGLTLLGIDDQLRIEPAPALVAGQPSVLRFLLPADASLSEMTPHLFQIAGTVARSVEADVAVASEPGEARQIRVTITPPAVTRVTRLVLRLGKVGSQPLVVFPAADKRQDIVSMSAQIEASGLRIAVCGRSPELRAYLRAQKIEFEDFGADAPDRLSPGSLLIGVLSEDDWKRLAAESPSASDRLLAFVDDPALLPGVYAQPDPSGRRYLAKITLPLAPLLAGDPQARETFHTLLRAALAPAPR